MGRVLSLVSRRRASVLAFLAGLLALGSADSNLEATVNTAPGTGDSHTVAVENNTTGATLLSCSISGYQHVLPEHRFSRGAVPAGKDHKRRQCR